MRVLLINPPYQTITSNVRAVQNGRVHVVDAESAFTTPGPGLAKACSVLASLLHDGTFEGTTTGRKLVMA